MTATYLVLTALAVLHAADAWLTYKVIRAGGYERNIFLAKVFKVAGVYWGLIATKAVVAALVWVYLRDNIPVLVAMIAIWSMIVINNWKVLESKR